MTVTCPAAEDKRAVLPSPFHALRMHCACTAGTAGILYVLLHQLGTIKQLDSEAGSRGSSGGYMAAVRGTADALAAAALPSGNLPTKMGDTEDV
jgi:hypothetical protein